MDETWRNETLLRLRQWIRSNGGTLAPDATEIVIPNLTPGTYAACFMTEQELHRIESGTAVLPSTACDTGSLFAGARLTLSPLNSATRPP